MIMIIKGIPFYTICGHLGTVCGWSPGCLRVVSWQFPVNPRSDSKGVSRQTQGNLETTQILPEGCPVNPKADLPKTAGDLPGTLICALPKDIPP